MALSQHKPIERRHITLSVPPAHRPATAIRATDHFDIRKVLPFSEGHSPATIVSFDLWPHPAHPASLGATDATAQAEILQGSGARVRRAAIFLHASAADLLATRGRGFVHVGPHQPAELHVPAHAMNEALGGRGATYDLFDPAEENPIAQAQSLHELVDDMHAGRVESLVIIDSNPVFAAPGVLGFGDALQRKPIWESVVRRHQQQAWRLDGSITP